MNDTEAHNERCKALIECIMKDVVMQRKGRFYLGLCPFHKEISPSFNLAVDGSRFHCFGCGISGYNVHAYEKLKEAFKGQGSEQPKRHHIDGYANLSEILVPMYVALMEGKSEDFELFTLISIQAVKDNLGDLEDLLKAKRWNGGKMPFAKIPS